MKLDHYLWINAIPVQEFAHQIHVHLNTMYTIIKGGTPSLENALKIEEATKGEVTCRDLFLNKKKTENPNHNANRKK